jgi:hypothetical protein
MKRLVWILLAAFCTALAQVQPVDLPVTKHEVCGCCEGSGSCGMPDCIPQPATNQPAPVAKAPLAQRTEARRLLSASRQKRESFPAVFGSRVFRVTTGCAPTRAAVAAEVPLFKVHCSFLI